MENSRNTTQIVDRMLEIQRDFRPHIFGIEEAFGGSVLAESIDRAIANLPQSFKLAFNLHTMPTGGLRKEVRIHRLGPFVTGGLLRFRRTPGTRILVSQLESWNPTVKSPETHDDGPDALEMAVRLGNSIGLFEGYDDSTSTARAAAEP